ncbi:PLDc N-terminal domain-containing protein [Paenibacillus sp. GCM10012303]|jgi:hypothetical protein|uniref:PLDc N-terminal domain-containing protein n=1 Tax=Paenibacillus sp. GCM10012303 TaxID=3317340 RepID=UPI0036086657
MDSMLSSVNWLLVMPIIVIQLILMAVALVDCIRAERTRGPKGLWIPVIVLIQVIGPIVYFVVGKEKAS